MPPRNDGPRSSRDGAARKGGARKSARRDDAPRPSAPASPRGSRAPRPLSERSRSPRPEPPSAAGPMRLQRALARAGVSSRRDAEELIAAGRVTVNGQLATIGQVVDPGRDAIVLDGQPVAAPAPREWLVLHKPAGVLTTREDPEGRPTVFSLVPPRPGLTYVGRLDYMTEGVLLFTTDGEAAHQLTHPSRGVERTYVAVVRGNAPAAVRELRRGVVLEDGPVHAEQVDARPLGNRTWELELTITEGRTREVRRVCEALDLEVLRLVRTRFGPVRLGSLAPGGVRPLNGAERAVIDTLSRARPARVAEPGPGPARGNEPGERGRVPARQGGADRGAAPARGAGRGAGDGTTRGGTRPTRRHS